MRLPISLAFIALLGACQVTKDDANNSVSVTYNSDVAENAAADVGNTAENIAGQIGNDVERTADKVDNRIGTHDADDPVDAARNEMAQ